MLGLLESVERDQAQSQRRLAADLGIALGLVNTYLKRCINKGLVKVRQAPARRYAYYLTPQGFAEKSRLTVNYLTASLSFFRQAKTECIEIFETARRRGYSRVVLAGRSGLAEIAIICAIDCGMEIIAVVDSGSKATHFVGVPLAKSFDTVKQPFDAVVVTDLENALANWGAAKAHIGSDRIFVPPLLRISTNQQDI